MINSLSQQLNQYITTTNGFISLSSSNSNKARTYYSNGAKLQAIDQTCQSIFKFMRENAQAFQEISQYPPEIASNIRLSLEKLYFQIRDIKKTHHLPGFSFLSKTILGNIADAKNAIREAFQTLASTEASPKKRFICMFNQLSDKAHENTAILESYLTAQTAFIESYELIKPFYEWVYFERNALDLRKQIGIQQQGRQLGTSSLRYRRLILNKVKDTPDNIIKLHENLDTLFQKISLRIANKKITLESGNNTFQPALNKQEISQLADILTMHVDTSKRKFQGFAEQLVKAHLAAYLSWYKSIEFVHIYSKKYTALTNEPSAYQTVAYQLRTRANSDAAYLASGNYLRASRIQRIIDTIFAGYNCGEMMNLNAQRIAENEDYISQLVESTPFPFSLQKISKHEPSLNALKYNYIGNTEQFQDFFIEHVDLKEIDSNFSQKANDFSRKRLYRFVHDKLHKINHLNTTDVIITPDLYEKRLSSLTLSKEDPVSAYMSELIKETLRRQKEQEEALLELSNSCLQEEKKTKFSKKQEPIIKSKRPSNQTSSSSEKKKNNSSLIQAAQESCSSSIASSPQLTDEETHTHTEVIPSRPYKAIHHRVKRWEYAGENLLENDIKYAHLDPSEYKEYTARHTFAKEVEQFVFENSLALTERSSNGTVKRFLRKCVFRFAEKEEDAVIELSIDDSGELFHKYIAPIVGKSFTSWHGQAELFEHSITTAANSELEESSEKEIWQYSHHDLERHEDDKSVSFVDIRRDFSITFNK